MRTSKPISTISYNSLPFLKDRLDNLVNLNIIDFYFFVWHKGEDDEGGEKDHVHVYAEPCKLVNTVDIREHFKEITADHQLPLGTIKWKPSKFMDAYLYFIHDKSYLAFKGQSRKYHYDMADIVTNDYEEFRYKVRSIDLMELTPYADMIQAQSDGLSWQEYFKRGRIPVQQCQAWEHAWYLLAKNVCYRNGKDGHE